MELGSYSEDQLDQIIAGSELEIGRIRSVQMTAISEKRRRKSHLVDGYRSMVDWTAARADVSHETARSICWTASRLADAPEVAEALAAGEISFDRAAQLARLPGAQRSGHEGYDISQLKRLVADHKRLTRRRERKTGNGYLHFGSSDEVATSIWGELPGSDSRIVERRSTSGPMRSSRPIGSWPSPNVGLWPWSPSAKTRSIRPDPQKSRSRWMWR
jgi:hypothetical protein